MRDHSAGEALLSLSPAHRHASFNHLHISIHLPQAMNYSTLQLPHENGERRHEKSLFPVFTLLLTLPPPPPPPLLPLSSGSLPHAPLSLWHREDKDGGKSAASNEYAFSTLEVSECKHQGWFYAVLPKIHRY